MYIIKFNDSGETMTVSAAEGSMLFGDNWDGINTVNDEFTVGYAS